MTLLYPPPWQDMATLCAHICLSPCDVREMIKNGELPAPERQSPKGPLWRWSQVYRMMSDGLAGSSRVYFIEMNEFIKIGFTRNLSRRLEELALGHPYEILLLHDIPGTFDTETDMHRRFRHLHVRGEWFKKDAELLEFIEQSKRDDAA